MPSIRSQSNCLASGAAGPAGAQLDCKACSIGSMIVADLIGSGWTSTWDLFSCVHVAASCRILSSHDSLADFRSSCDSQQRSPKWFRTV